MEGKIYEKDKFFFGGGLIQACTGTAVRVAQVGLLGTLKACW